MAYGYGGRLGAGGYSSTYGKPQYGVNPGVAGMVRGKGPVSLRGGVGEWAFLDPNDPNLFNRLSGADSYIQHQAKEALGLDTNFDFRTGQTWVPTYNPVPGQETSGYGQVAMGHAFDPIAEARLTGTPKTQADFDNALRAMMGFSKGALDYGRSSGLSTQETQGAFSGTVSPWAQALAEMAKKAGIDITNDPLIKSILGYSGLDAGSYRPTGGPPGGTGTATSASTPGQIVPEYIMRGTPPGVSRQTSTGGTAQTITEGAADPMERIGDLETRVRDFTNKLRAQGVDPQEQERLAIGQFRAEIEDLVGELDQGDSARVPAWMREFLGIHEQTGGAGRAPAPPPALGGASTVPAEQSYLDWLSGQLGEGDVGQNLGSEEFMRALLRLPDLGSSDLLGPDMFRDIGTYLISEAGDTGLDWNSGKLGLGAEEFKRALLRFPELGAHDLMGPDMFRNIGTDLIGGYGDRGMDEAVENWLLSMMEGGGPPNQGNLDAFVTSLMGGAGEQGLSNRDVLGTLSSGGPDPYGGESPLTPEYVDAFRRRVYDPARQRLLGDLGQRGLLDSSERMKQETDLLDQGFIDTLMGRDMEARQFSAELGSRNRLAGGQLGLEREMGLGQQGIRGFDTSRRGITDLLGLTADSADRFERNRQNLLSLGIDAENADRMAAQSLFSMELGGRKDLLGLTADSADRFERNRQNLLALGIDAENADRLASQSLLSMQLGGMQNARDFGYGQNRDTRDLLADFLMNSLNRQSNERVNKETLDANRRSGRNQLLGAGIGAAADVAGSTAQWWAPWLAGLFSSKRFKHDIVRDGVNPDEMLSVVNGTRLVRFKYHGPDDKEHVGIILEDSDPILASSDGTHIDVDIVGVLIGAIQSQQRQIRELGIALSTLARR